jgi:group II intron reverse transcriptase/maturase
VQEVIRELLEAIYEPIFCEHSHGFRPNKSCHTALYQIKSNCRGTNWVVEGDITRYFETVNHEILLELLARKISDGRFLELIRRFLEAGYFEFRQVYNSLSGTPQGNVLSPILANVYLHEFDKYMMALTKEYSLGARKRANPIYQKLATRRRQATKHKKFQEAKELLKQMQTLHSVDSMDKDFIRMKYCRFADDFLVCVIGSRTLALEIKSKITCFMKQTLKLELNQEKTSVTNLSDRSVRFLGYELAKARCNSKLTKHKDGHKRRSLNGEIELLVPGQVIRDKLKPFKKGNKPYPFAARINYPVLVLQL